MWQAVKRYEPTWKTCIILLALPVHNQLTHAMYMLNILVLAGVYTLCTCFQLTHMLKAIKGSLPGSMIKYKQV